MDERYPCATASVVLRPVESNADGKLSLPGIIEQAGHNARFAYEEFFHAKIRNAHTRRAYRRAVLCFLQWCDDRQRRLEEVSPADVGIYLDELTLSVASKKQVLAGLRHFFDGMVIRHAIALNPALSVRGERYQVMEGKTPEITIKQARKLLLSINIDNVVGLRDKAIMSILIYTASRVGAVARLKLKDLYDTGDQYCLHFLDKGGKGLLETCRRGIAVGMIPLHIGDDRCGRIEPQKHVIIFVCFQDKIGRTARSSIAITG